MGAIASSPALAPSLHQILADAAALSTGKSAAWVEGENAGEGGAPTMGTTKKDEEDEERRGEAEGVCFVDNAVELREAIEHKSCSLVQLAARSDGVGEEEQEQVGGWVGGREGGREGREGEKAMLEGLGEQTRHGRY